MEAPPLDKGSSQPQQPRSNPAANRQAENIQNAKRQVSAHSQLVQMVFEAKVKVAQSPQGDLGSLYTQAELAALANTTNHTRLYGTAYGTATGVTVAGLMRAINPAAFSRRPTFWMWMVPSIGWGAAQGVQAGFKRSLTELLNLPDSPLSDKLLGLLQANAPKSPLLASVRPRTIATPDDNLQGAQGASMGDGADNDRGKLEFSRAPLGVLGERAKQIEQARRELAEKKQQYLRERKRLSEVAGSTPRDDADDAGDDNVVAKPEAAERFEVPEVAEAPQPELAAGGGGGGASGGFFGATMGWGGGSGGGQGPSQGGDSWGDDEAAPAADKELLAALTPEGRAARAAARRAAQQQRQQEAGRQRYGRFADPDTGGYRMGDDSWDESDRDDPENADDKVDGRGQRKQLGRLAENRSGLLKRREQEHRYQM